MHGTNIVRKSEDREDGALQVHNVWYTLQGEGPFSGNCAVFVRLTGCNLRCWFCDTEWDDDEDPVLSYQDVATAVKAAMPDHCTLVVITGGEPMRQRLAPFIAELMKDPDVHVQLETAGTLWQEELMDHDGIDLERLFFVVSPKTPTVAPGFHTFGQVIYKYVIRAGDQFPPVRSTQIKDAALDRTLAVPPTNETGPAYLTPCDEGDPVKNQENMVHMATIALATGHTASVQIHKLLKVE